MKEYLMGDDALAAGAFESGVKVVAGYPGTPATEIVESCAKYKDVHVEWSCNEKVATEIALMASLCNVRSMAVMKHNGTNVATDFIMHLNFTGVKGGMVLVSADDPGANSSQNEEDTRILTHVYGHLPLLDPSTAAEAREMIKLAFDYSEKVESCVVMRPVMRICHSRSIIELSDEKRTMGEPNFENDRSRFVMSAVSEPKAGGRMRPLWRHQLLNEKQKEFEQFSEESTFNALEKGDGEIGFVGCGIGYTHIKEAEDISALKVPLLKLCTLPLPRKKVVSFLKSVKKAVVFEEIEPVVERMLKQICQEEGLTTKILGREDFLPSEGELSPEIVLDAMERLGFDIEVKKYRRTVNINIPIRTRTQCVGCPHRGMLSALKQAARKHKAVVVGDIGCHDAGSFPPYELQSTIYCMGSSIPMAQGLKASGMKNPVVAVIGDSTFFHSGITGLVNAVYQNQDVMVVLCDNSTTAMTGFQPHPGSGEDIRGKEAPKIEITRIGEALGISPVIINPYDIEGSKRVIDELLPQKGVRLVISKAPCYLRSNKLKIKLFEPRQTVMDAEKCNGCKLCITDLGCPALRYSNGKVNIDLKSCVKCGLCADICKRGAITICN